MFSILQTSAPVRSLAYSVESPEFTYLLRSLERKSETVVCLYRMPENEAHDLKNARPTHAYPVQLEKFQKMSTSLEGLLRRYILSESAPLDLLQDLQKRNSIIKNLQNDIEQDRYWVEYGINQKKDYLRLIESTQEDMRTIKELLKVVWDKAGRKQLKDQLAESSKKITELKQKIITQEKSLRSLMSKLESEEKSLFSTNYNTRFAVMTQKEAERLEEKMLQIQDEQYEKCPDFAIAFTVN